MTEFIERHGLWSDDQRDRAREIGERLEKDGIRLVRAGLGRPARRVAGQDGYGGRRSSAALTNGYNINVATATLDASGARVFSSFIRGGGMGLDEMTGSPNLAIVPDPATFRVLAVGARRRLDPVRRIFRLRRAVSFFAAASAAQAAAAASASDGLRCVVGLEVEWYLLRAGRRTPDRRAYRRARHARAARSRPFRSSRAIRFIPKPIST